MRFTPSGPRPGPPFNLPSSPARANRRLLPARAREVLAAGRSANGHVFNLGHGVPPETNPDTLARLTDLVHEASARTPA